MVPQACRHNTVSSSVVSLYVLQMHSCQCQESVVEFLSKAFKTHVVISVVVWIPAILIFGYNRKFSLTAKSGFNSFSPFVTAGHAAPTHSVLAIHPFNTLMITHCS